MLRVSRWVLQGLLILNFVAGPLLLLLLGWSILHEERFAAIASRQYPEADVDHLLLGARLALAATVPVIALAHLIFRNLLALLATVEAREPFAAANANRLRIVAWCLLGIQLCDIAFGIGGTIMDTAAGEHISAWSPGLTGWIAVLLVFVLAQVFREGARLRAEAELTI